MPTAPPLTSRERHGLWIAFAVAVALAAAFAWVVAPSASPMRATDG
jgi:p-aminobenzoyl-glutamate transporter AbgT